MLHIDKNSGVHNSRKDTDKANKDPERKSAPRGGDRSNMTDVGQEERGLKRAI